MVDTPLNAVESAEDRDAKRIGRVVLFVRKHWFLFGWVLSGCIAIYQMFMTMRSDIDAVKKDTAALTKSFVEIEKYIKDNPKPRRVR